jgi:hypothetical protein
MKGESGLVRYPTHSAKGAEWMGTRKFASWRAMLDGEASSHLGSAEPVDG